MSKLLWTQKQDIGPQPRSGHTMVFEASRQRVLLFGGFAGGSQFLNDTWSWNGEDWTQLADLGPSARSLHAMAYDSVRDRTVLFGGHAGTAEFGDTWEWDGEAWTQIEDAGPSARFGHGMVFDEARQVTTLFGGGHGAAAPEADTWTWDGTNWQQVEDTGPAARTSHAMAFDRARSVAVVFGGNGSDLTTSFGDTWEWDGSLWKRVQDIGATAATGAAMVFRTAVSALFGGISAIDNVAGRKLFGLTWEWNGQHWTARQDIGVGARFRHAMAYDSARARVVLFGGLSVPPDAVDADSQLKGDTWEHPDSGGGQPQAGTEASVVALSVQPSQATANEMITIEVILSGPAPPQGQTISIASDIPPFNGQLPVQGGMPGITTQVQIPPDIGNFIPIPFQGTLTASASDGSQAAAPLLIQ